MLIRVVMDPAVADRQRQVDLEGADSDLVCVGAAMAAGKPTREFMAEM